MRAGSTCSPGEPAFLSSLWCRQGVGAWVLRVWADRGGAPTASSRAPDPACTHDDLGRRADTRAHVHRHTRTTLAHAHTRHTTHTHTRTHALLDDLGRRADHVLPLLVLDQVQVLQRADDVIGLDRREVRELLDGDRAVVRRQDLRARARVCGLCLCCHALEIVPSCEDRTCARACVGLFCCIMHWVVSRCAVCEARLQVCTSNVCICERRAFADVRAEAHSARMTHTRASQTRAFSSSRVQ